MGRGRQKAKQQKIARKLKYLTTDTDYDELAKELSTQEPGEGSPDPFADIETISPRPMLFITGENAHSREFSEDAYSKAAEPKELYIVPGAGHVDLYDRVSLIPFDKLDSFFKEYLK